MDYDKTDLASKYDAARGLSPEAMKLWLNLVSGNVLKESIKDIVDLGCGTGRFTAPLAEHFGASVTGVEPSDKMRAQAEAKKLPQNVRFVSGSGESIPVGDNSTDLVFISMAMHHFKDIPATARECHRILRSHGFVCIRNSTIETGIPYAPFIPAVEKVIKDELVTRDELQTPFLSGGFDLVKHEVVGNELAKSWMEYVDKLTAHADSFLERIDREDLRDGLARLRAHARTQNPNEPVMTKTDFFVFKKKD
ncbi:class I SAM-dependent methyltransferase [Candidatus Kaiserbacteria bacterium]|nr:class I SAM-dependent methyltransferase [Candidatus Kaiserbacteria bacterium]